MEEDIGNKIFRDYNEKVLKDFLPNEHVRHLSSFNRIPERFDLDGSNICLENSDYYNKPSSDFALIHFTSFDNFRNILSTNILRLYDLNYADDPNEIVFALKHTDFSFSKEQEFNIKSWLYSCSFCKYPFSSDEEEYNLWRLYGSDGNGVALLFSINNDVDNWYDFHLSKIYYQDQNKLDKIQNAIRKHIDFVKEFFNEKGIEITDNNKLLPRDITKFLAFHKHSLFEIENEFRLLFYERLNDNSNIKAFKSFNKRYETSVYIELPLFTRQKDLFQKEPSLVLQKVILGHRFSEEVKRKIQDGIDKIFINNHRLNISIHPEVIITNLKEKYFN